MLIYTSMVAPDRSAFLPPDHHRTSGFGRDYLEDQFRESTLPINLSAVRDELDEFFKVDPSVELFRIRSTWVKTVLSKLATGNTLATLTARKGEQYIVEDAIFENVLQAHHYSLRQQSLEMRPDFDNQVDEFKTLTQAFVDADIFPSEATEKLGNLEDIGFVASDNYVDPSTFAEVHRGYSDSQNTPADVILYPLGVERGEPKKSTIFHELLHVLGDNARQSLIDLLVKVLPDKRACYDIALQLEEGLTEHITEVMMGKRTIDNTSISDNDPPIYVSERRFLDAINQDGNGHLIRPLISTYFGAKINQSSIQELQTTLSKSGGVDLEKHFVLSDYDAQEKLFASLISKVENKKTS
ncbi:MAG: hypothetical protein JWO99_124 [Candidatus Saccharibacteria bacterium]|nr:hypothetical protein [Candidatus Saccharibacteria bacterium]